MENRELSPFICRELLYDYLMDNLDEQRKSAVKKHLASNDRTQDELEELQSALKCCEELSGIQLSQAQLEEIISRRNSWTYFLRWVSPRCWSPVFLFSVEALLVSAVAFIVTMWIPWDQFFFFKNKESIELVQVKRKVPVSHSHQGGYTQEKHQTMESLQTVLSSPLRKMASDMEVRALFPVGVGRHLQGISLFKATVRLTNVEAMVPLIIQKVRELGGVREEVDLGGGKKEGRYFQFKMPEASYESFVSFLKDFGPVQMHRESGGRVMPEGEICFILWVKGN